MVDAAGAAYVAGVTSATDFPITPGALQTTRSGASSMFITKISDVNDTSTTLAVSPAAGVAGQAITLTASLTGNQPNPGGSIAFYDGATQIGTVGVNAGKATLATSALAGGMHALTAVYSGDSNHNPSTSGVVNLNLTSPNILPTIQLSGMADGTLAAAPYSPAVDIMAQAGPGNLLYKIQLFLNGQIVSTTTLAQNQFAAHAQWQPLTAGSYFLSAEATDHFGRATVSAPLRLSVNAPGTPPTVSLSAPANGAAYAAGTPIVLTATAGAASGATITRVDFYRDTTLIGSSSTSPYSVTWNNAVPGKYALSASAVDSKALSKFAEVVNISVAPPPGGVPMAPIIYAANAEVELAFLYRTAPAYVGASPLTGYTATCSAAGNATIKVSTGTDVDALYVKDMKGGVTYTCSLTASNTQGVSLPSNAVSVTPTVSTMPKISITAPLDNSTISTQGPVTVRVVASSQVSTIAQIRIRIWGGPELASYAPPGAVAAVTYDVIWANRPVGSHDLYAEVTDATGHIHTSSITVNVVDGPSVTLKPDAVHYLAPAAVTLTATPTAAAGAPIAKVDFHQGATLLGTVSAAPYTVRWTNVGAGAYPVSATVTDSHGVTATATVTVDVLAAPGITLDAGQDGGSVNDDRVTITGQVQTVLNSAVDVNGQVGVIAADGSFFVPNVPLQPGPNTLTLTLTTADGAKAVKTLTVTGSGPALFGFDASAGQGFAPLTVGLSLSKRGDLGTAAVTRVDLLCQDGGAVSVSVGTAGNGSFADCSYPEAGTYRIRVNVYGNAPGQAEQLLYSGTQSVSAVASLDRIMIVRAIYAGLIDRLKAGNTVGALSLFSDDAKAQYSDIFTKLGTDLPTFAGQLGAISAVTVSEEIAEIVIVRNVEGSLQSFIIYLTLDEDGIWRISSM